MKYFLVGALVVLCLFGMLPGALSALAQGEDREEAFVYGINALLPGEVIGTFAPPIVETIYLLAEHPNVLSPRRTLVYFWAITNEYRAAWSEMNELVEGTLEIVRDGAVVATVEQVPYTIHFASDGGTPLPELYVGQEALEAQDRFEKEQAAFQQASLAYRNAREAWLELVREAQAKGQGPEALPPPPEPPQPLTIYSTGLNKGYPIQLEEGSYRVRVREPDGAIVPGSERGLVVFAPRRTAVGYKVIPEARWTFPEELSDLSDAILGQAGSVLYLQPQVIREYPTLAYERLQNPQYPGDASGSEWQWVGGEILEDAVLEVVHGEQVVDQIPLQAYFVRQTPGRELGYEIIPYDPATPDLTPRMDFVGYRLALLEELPQYEVQLRSAEGALLEGSARKVRVVPTIELPRLLLFPLIPIAAGTSLLWWRRRQTARLQAQL